MSVYLIPHIHLPDPPEYANTASVQHSQLMVTAPFTLNCTPSAANPPVDTVSIEVDGSPVTSSDTVTEADNVLTIPSVQRSHSGNYSCTATNTRGSAIVYHNFLVVGVLMQLQTTYICKCVWGGGGGRHGKTARFGAKCVRQWDVVFNLFSISFVTFRLSWSQLHFVYILYNPRPLPPQPLPVDQRTWPFPPLDHTVSLSPGTHPLMMGGLPTT